MTDQIHRFVEPDPFQRAWKISDSAEGYAQFVEEITKAAEITKAIAEHRCDAFPVCKRKPTHVYGNQFGEYYACTPHAIYWNLHEGTRYRPLPGVVITDDDRAKAKELGCCRQCSKFYLKKSVGVCTRCRLCKTCATATSHAHCPGCDHRLDDSSAICVVCKKGQCCTEFCMTCWEAGDRYCIADCLNRPAAQRHPPLPPNRHMSQGIYVEGHDWNTYPERRPKEPPYTPFLYLGVELEVECGRRDRQKVAQRILTDHKYDLLIKHDGSLENGLECVTGPMSLEEHQRFWPVVVPNLLKAGCRAWDYVTPGMHVHGSRDWYTSLTLGKLLVFLNSPRTKEYHVRLAGREIWWAGQGAKISFINKKLSDGFPPHNLLARFGVWAKPETGRMYHALSPNFDWVPLAVIGPDPVMYLRQTLCVLLPEGTAIPPTTTLAELEQRGLIRRTKRKKGVFATTASRYEALNLQNKATIEFRLFKSTLKTDHILANIEYCHAASRWALDTSLREAESWPSFWEWLGRHPTPYPHLIAFFEHAKHDDSKVERSIKEVNA